MADRVILILGELRLVLAPQVGGSIAAFEWRGQPLMRAAPADYDDPLSGACFPLVPYCNRIKDGGFTFRGREVRLSPTIAADPSPLHGDGWQSAWSVEEASASAATLAYLHEPSEWPWRYEARQRFELAESGLAATISCRNLSDEPMPCGLGFHPYWPCSPGARLRTRVAGAYTIDEKVLPVARVPATGRYDLADRVVCGQDLDNGFDGWSGQAQLVWPERGIALDMASQDARFFQLYSPPSGALFVAEPVGHANAALNAPEERWAELGIRVLAPGEEASLTATFAPSAL